MMVYCKSTHWLPNSDAQNKKPVLSTLIDEHTGTVSKYLILISVTYGNKVIQPYYQKGDIPNRLQSPK